MWMRWYETTPGIEGFAVNGAQEVRRLLISGEGYDEDYCVTLSSVMA